MTSDNEVAFDLSLRRRGLHSFAVNDDGDHESEICGSLGSISRITVLDGALLELHGSQGTMRISMPERYLKLFEKQSSCTRNG